MANPAAPALALHDPCKSRGVRKLSVDTVLRVRLKHRVGQLARVAAAIASEGGLLGDIVTLSIGAEDTLREITVETESDEQAARVVAAVQNVDGVELAAVADRIFEAHRGGKIHSGSRVSVEQVRDLRTIYTPGVARVVRAIEREPQRAFELTSLARSVGIFTNGTRVLGLGDVGTLASMPVMEGKAVLYDRFAGLSATPILVDTRDREEFVNVVERIAGSFGGIHLEDIRSPDCYFIEDELRRRLSKPVLHDDQHGTATVALAATINACRLTGLDLGTAVVGQIGLGAAGSAIARLIMAYGVKDVLVTDPAPAAVERMVGFGARALDLAGLMEQADIVIATSGRPGLIPPASIRPGQVILALSNPDPEIDPPAATAAGAAYAADGRSINNALAFPGLFAGAFVARSRSIEAPMLIEAAVVIADHAEKGELVPSPLGRAVHAAVTAAVAARARALGLENTARP
jgi:malate dehydrogenase (oxaloacetate-decarboxylating)